MLTDDEIDHAESELYHALAKNDTDAFALVDRLAAQAREANALRAQLANATRVVERMIGVDADVDKLAMLLEEHRDMAIMLYETQEQLAEVHQLVTEMHKVVEAARLAANPPWGPYPLCNVLHKYDDFLASQPTNVPALIPSMVVARVTTNEAGETTMEPATVDGKVKR